MKEFKKMYLPLEWPWKLDPDWEGVCVAAVIYHRLWSQCSPVWGNAACRQSKGLDFTDLMSSWIGLEGEWQRKKKALEMKRKPREPDQHYWLDLPTREPLSFCQANSAPTSLPRAPDPTSPSLFPSFRLFLCVRQGCSNSVLRLGTHWAVAMVTGKLFMPCASKGTFPLLEFLPPLCAAQWGSFSFAPAHVLPRGTWLHGPRGIEVAAPACPAHSDLQSPVLPLPRSLLKQLTSVKTVKYNPAMLQQDR